MPQWAARPAATFWAVDMARPFVMPYIAGTEYAPGAQPNAPGQSVIQTRMVSSIQPWPGMVPVINALASNYGVPRAPAPVPVVDAYSTLPSEYLYIGGFVGKSQG